MKGQIIVSTGVEKAYCQYILGRMAKEFVNVVCKCEIRILREHFIPPGCLVVSV